MAEQLIAERKKNGAYDSLQDLIERTGIGRESLNILIRIGALRFTGKHKKALLWEANFLQGHQLQQAPVASRLFREPPLELVLPALPSYPLEELYDQVELLGFPLYNPFPMADEDPHQYIPAVMMANHLGQTITMMGYLITYKPVRTVKGDTMCFGTFIDIALNWIDTVHFPDSLQRYPLQGNGFYRLTGKVVEDFGVYNLEVHQMNKIGLKKKTSIPEDALERE
jgi:DNA polymerase-3 subunit alpha